MSVAQFNSELDRFTKRLAPDLLVPFHQKLALDLLRRIAIKTPVDTGRARGNWQTSINQWSEEEHFSSDPVGEGATVLARIPPFATIFLTNNVSYIIYLEEGSSKQAPEGMVAISLEEMRAIFP